MIKTAPSNILPPKVKSVIVELSTIPKKFLEKGSKPHNANRLDAFIRTSKLTQEFIAQMLGCRRSGVTVAAGALSRSGMISYKRGTINILNREDLEDTSCECYSIVKNEYARLLAIPG